MTAAGLVLAGGLMFMFGLRQRYDSPPNERFEGAVVAPPDALRPGIAGALAANGSVSLQHAMASLFALADRHVVTITEEPRKWGQRHFTLHRRLSDQALAPEETVVLDLAFHHKSRRESQPPDQVSLTEARTRIASRLKAFKTAVNQELRALGMLDDERMRVRARYLGFATLFVILAFLLVIPAAFLARQYDAWPFLVVGAVAAIGIVGFIFYGALTPLSNEGVRRAERWRAYQQHLKEVAKERAHLTSDSPSRLLPFAVALGLAAAWSKFLKSHPVGVPPWFSALAVSGDDGGFTAFIAAGGAGADGGAGGGGGVAAARPAGVGRARDSSQLSALSSQLSAFSFHAATLAWRSARGVRASGAGAPARVR